MLVAAVNKMDARLEDGQKRFNTIETRQAVNETRMNIEVSKEDKDETSDFAIKGGRATVDLKKVNWQAVIKTATYFAPWLVAAFMAFKNTGGENEQMRNDHGGVQQSHRLPQAGQKLEPR